MTAVFPLLDLKKNKGKIRLNFKYVFFFHDTAEEKNQTSHYSDYNVTADTLNGYKEMGLISFPCNFGGINLI